MVLLLALAGCLGTSRDSFDSGGSGLVCGAWLTASEPTSGEEDVWWTEPIVLSLTRAIHEGEVQTNLGEGTTTLNGAIVTFVPDAPWPPASTVVATLIGCGGSLGVSFATAASGLPVDAAAVPGHSWQLGRDSSGALDSLRILDRMYGVTWPMLGVAGSAESLTLSLFAASAAGETCDGWTGQLDAAWVTDSFVSVESDTLTVLVGGTAPVPLRLEHFFVGFTPDGSAVEGTHLIGTLDVRDVAAAASLGVTVAEVCDLLGSFGVQCTPCADGEESCAPVAVDDLTSAPVDPATLEWASASCGG